MKSSTYVVYVANENGVEKFNVSIVQYKRTDRAVTVTFSRLWEQEDEPVILPYARFPTFVETIKMRFAEAVIEVIDNRSDQDIITQILKREYGLNATITFE